MILNSSEIFTTLTLHNFEDANTIVSGPFQTRSH